MSLSLAVLHKVMFVDLLTKSVWYVLLVVDIEEIKRLGKRFKKLDLDKSGSLSVDEFMSLPELQQNPLVQRVIDIFDTDGNGEVDFKGMLALFIVFYLSKSGNMASINHFTKTLKRCLSVVFINITEGFFQAAMV